MEEMNIALRPPIAVKPDKEERRQIRKKYNLTALVMIINIVAINVIGNVIIIAACMALGGGFSFEAYQTGREALAESSVLYTILSFVPIILSEAAAIIIGAKLLKINMKKLTSNREGYSGGTVAKLITLCYGIQLPAMAIVLIIQAMIGDLDMGDATASLTPSSSFASNLLMISYVCVIGPVLEEMLYRGILLQSMRKYSERFAIILSAVIFGLMHQNYQQCIPAIIMGIPLAIIAIKYNSIVPTIFAHIFLNTMNMFQMYLLQYLSPGLYDTALSGNMEASALELSSSAMAGALAILLVRLIFMIAALAVGIVALVKGGNTKIPTPAGKSRAMPVFRTAALWWIVFAAYIFLTFVLPFIR